MFLKRKTRPEKAYAYGMLLILYIYIYIIYNIYINAKISARHV